MKRNTEEGGGRDRKRDLPLKWREKSRLKFVLRKTERERDRVIHQERVTRRKSWEKDITEKNEDKQVSVEDIKENNIRSDIIWH